MFRVALVATLLCSALTACGPKSMSARREHSQRLADEADEELSKAEKAMGELKPQDAEDALAAAKKRLAEPDAQLYPEYEMLLGREKEDEARLPDVKRVRELKDLQAAVGKRREKIEEQAAALKKALKALEVPNVESGQIDDAQAAAKDLAEALADGAELEPKDKAYAEYARGRRAEAEKAREPISLARARADFMSGPAVLREKAAEKFKEGKGEKASADKKARFAEAKKLYEQCQETCRKALTASPGMSRLAIIASGKKTTPEALDTACSAEWQEVDKADKKVKPDKVAPPPKKKR
ncbi:MAG: hypothetical protein IPJ65_27935 [Archangiaceae bacterium]|nr:hypothetical protein [Archangiaceae bacterium]